jgi:uncharacterized protein (TIGR03085 family)
MSGGFAVVERNALADLLATLGPDQPTLCEGWTTRDLAAHLVVRAANPVAAGGIVFSPLAGYLERTRRRAAAQDWPALVERVRRRPVWAWPDEDATNHVEYFVHHEDIRRAQPQWEPRELIPTAAAALWRRVRVPAKLALRRTPAAVTVSAPGLGTMAAGRGGRAVTLSGPPGELAMFLTGRQRQARVELTGPEEIVARMRTAHYGV